MEWLADFVKQNGVAVTFAVLLLLFLGFRVWPDLVKRLDQARADLLAQQASNEVRISALQDAHEARMVAIQAEYESRMTQMRADHKEDEIEVRVSFLDALNKVTEETTKAIKENTSEIKRIRLKDKIK